MAEDGRPSVTAAIDTVLAENKLRWSASGDHASGETRRDQVRRFSDMSGVIENIKNRFNKMAVIDKHGKNMAVTVGGASKIVAETQRLFSSQTTPPPPPPPSPCRRLSIRSHATACFLSNHARTAPPSQRRLSTRSDAKVGCFTHHERSAPSPSLRCSSRRAKLECRASNNQVAPKSSFRRGGYLGRSSHVAKLERKACPRCSRWCKYESKTCSLIICPSCGKRVGPQTSSSAQA